MSRISPHFAVLLAIAAVAACNDEPLSPGSAFRNGAGGAPGLQASVTGSPGDYAALQDIVSTFDQSWTAGDAVTYAEQYAGAEWVGPNGLVLTDPAAITGLYTAILTFALPGTTRQSIIRGITFLTGTIAVLDIDARVTGFTQLPPGLVPWRPDTLRALEKNIVVKRGGEWQIVKHQQTFVNPEVQ